MIDMLKSKVIATHVTNLTDARYFAARGVDYLLFDMDTISVDSALEIKEWVAGPDILLLFSSSSLSELDEAVIKLSPLGISGKTADDVASISHLSTHTDIFPYTENSIEFNDVTFVKLDHQTDLGSSEALIIRGGEEEAVGIKSFDELDDVFDALEIEI